MYFRNRDYKDDTLFKTRLKTLMDKAGIKSARALAGILFEEKMVYIKPMKEDAEEWKFKQDRIGAIEKKVQAHLNADTPAKVTGEYIEAYCKLFHCSPDYLFCRTVIEADDIEVRRFCEMTGLSEAAVTRLVESGTSEIPLRPDLWSIIIESRLYETLPSDWGSLCREILSYNHEEAEIKATEWLRDHSADKTVKAIQEVKLKEMYKQIDRHEPAYYGYLAKISRDVSNCLDKAATELYDTEDIKSRELENSMRFVKEVVKRVQDQR